MRNPWLERGFSLGRRLMSNKPFDPAGPQDPNNVHGSDQTPQASLSDTLPGDRASASELGRLWQVADKGAVARARTLADDLETTRLLALVIARRISNGELNDRALHAFAHARLADDFPERLAAFAADFAGAACDLQPYEALVKTLQATEGAVSKLEAFVAEHPLPPPA